MYFKFRIINKKMCSQSNNLGYNYQNSSQLIKN